jgi:signal transduction histidine kinase
VQDDGRGFDPATLKPGLGLSSSAGRVDQMGGTWRIKGAPGQGTSVTAELPLV